MATLNVDVGNSDVVIDGTDTTDDTNVINITALGSHSLTVDGVSASVGSVLPIGVGVAPTFAAINGGDLSIDYGSIGVSALSSVNYNVGAASTISVKGPDILGLTLGTQTVNFSGGSGSAFSYESGLIDTVTSMNVNGFSWGDSLAVEGYSFSNFNYDATSGNGTLSFAEGGFLGGNFTYNLNGLDPELAAQIQADPASFFVDGAFVAPVCFFHGTLITTDRGPVPVEKLVKGDKVKCLSGMRDVQWVGYRHDWVRRIPDERRMDFWPVVICKDAIAANVPSSDLRVSPWHHLYVEGVLIRANDLVNDLNIYRDTSVRKISYYHIELDQFDVIEAHNLYSESYADGGNRDFFHNADVSQIAPANRIRRRAERPGFNALRDAHASAPMQKRYRERAEALQSLDQAALRKTA